MFCPKTYKQFPPWVFFLIFFWTVYSQYSWHIFRVCYYFFREKLNQSLSDGNKRVISAKWKKIVIRLFKKNKTKKRLEAHRWNLYQAPQIINGLPPTLKVTRHLCFRNSKNLQLLDVQACNSANRAAFQNPTKSLSAPWSIDVKSVVTF